MVQSTTPITSLAPLLPRTHNARTNLPIKTLLDDQEPLRSHFYAIFESAHVFLQFRRPLADALLAEDGPGHLRRGLGWICYAERTLPHVERGAVVYIALRDRLPCDSAYLPPPDLPFDEALAWALRGGQEDSPYDDGRDLADAGFDEPALPSLPAPPETPAAQLWRAALERLSRELSPGVVQNYLRAARLDTLDDQQLILVAQTPQARDWLANRLTAVLARTLRELTGQPLSVEIRCEPEIAGVNGALASL